MMVSECLLLGVERKSDFEGSRSVEDPGCVKTSTRGEAAELFSLFSSFDSACQRGSFLIQRNRDKRSTRKLDVGVFTQPGPKADIADMTGRRLPHGRFSRTAAWPNLTALQLSLFLS